MSVTMDIHCSFWDLLTLIKAGLFEVLLRPGGGGAIMAPRPPKISAVKRPDLRENLHACQVKCIEQYDNFNFLKKIPHLHIYGNLCK